MRLAIRAEAHAIAVMVRIGLRLLSIPRLLNLLGGLPRVHAVGTADECASAALEAVRRVAHPTCLFSSMTLFAMLARRGRSPRLVLGAALDGRFGAHAWLTVGGVPVIAPSRDYVPLWTGGTSAAGAR